MSEVNRVLAHIKKLYPNPEPDPAWIKECMAVLRASGDDTSPAAMLEQYIHSDLAISAQPTLPANVSDLHKRILFPRPTLLQVLSVMDIGTSAVVLQNTLEQRKDVFEGKTRIRGMDEGEDEEQIIPGKVPDYPRAMLKMDLGDGSTTVRAIEFKRIGAINLGETGLGCKLLLHNVKITRGILMLTPANTTYVGGYVDALERDQPPTFIASLAHRLEVAKAHNPGAGLPKARRAPRSTAPKATKAARSTPMKTDLSIPEARLKYVPPPEAGPSRSNRTTNGAKPARPGRKSMPISVVDSSEDEDPQAAARRRRAEAIRAAMNEQPEPPSDDYGLDFEDEVDEGLLMQLEAVEQAGTQKQSPYFANGGLNANHARATARTRRDDQSRYDNGINDEDDYDFDDDVDFGQIDEAEVAAAAAARSSGVRGRAGKGPTQSSEVIVISD